MRERDLSENRGEHAPITSASDTESALIPKVALQEFRAILNHGFGSMTFTVHEGRVVGWTATKEYRDADGLTR